MTPLLKTALLLRHPLSCAILVAFAVPLRRLGIRSTRASARINAPRLARYSFSDRYVQPQAIRKVLDAWSLPTNHYADIAYLGDAPSDVTAAREVGVMPLAAAWALASDAVALDAMCPAATFRAVEEFAGWIYERVGGDERVAGNALPLASDRVRLL